MEGTHLVQSVPMAKMLTERNLFLWVLPHSSPSTLCWPELSLSIPVLSSSRSGKSEHTELRISDR